MKLTGLTHLLTPFVAYAAAPAPAPAGGIPLLWLCLFAGGAPPQSALPADLYEALARWFESSGLGNWFPGGYSFGRAPVGAAAPYVVASEIARVPHFTSAAGYVETIDLRFSVYAEGAGDAATLGERFRAAFDFASLSFLDGYLMQLRRTGGAMVDPTAGMRYPDDARARGGIILHRRDFTYRAMVGRQRP